MWVGPQAGFSCTTNGFSVSCNGGSSKGASAYQWSWGDGGTGGGSKPFGSHTYAAAGTYTVSLVVQDDMNVSSASATQSVTLTKPNASPTITATPDRVSGSITLSVKVTLAVQDADNDAVSGTYFCGVGNDVPISFTNTAAGVSKMVSCDYPAPGDFQIGGRVTDGNGGAAAFAQSIAHCLCPEPLEAIAT